MCEEAFSPVYLYSSPGLMGLVPFLNRAIPLGWGNIPIIPCGFTAAMPPFHEGCVITAAARRLLLQLWANRFCSWQGLCYFACIEYGAFAPGVSN